jgi:hypothetical protein
MNKLSSDVAVLVKVVQVLIDNITVAANTIAGIAVVAEGSSISSELSKHIGGTGDNTLTRSAVEDVPGLVSGMTDITKGHSSGNYCSGQKIALPQRLCLKVKDMERT